MLHVMEKHCKTFNLGGENMHKRKKDYGEYNFNRNWITNHPIATQSLLGIGMMEPAFHRIVGDFEDWVSCDNKKLEKIFNGKEIIISEKLDWFTLLDDGKPKEYFWSAERIEAFRERIIFYENLHAMIGNMLQVMRLRFPLIRLERDYRNTKTFVVKLIVQLKAKEGFNYYVVPVEFMGEPMTPQFKNSIKIFCSTYQSYEKDFDYLCELSDKRNYILAFYDERNRRLPLFIENSKIFKGNSYFISGLFIRMVLNNILEENRIGKEGFGELQEEYRMLYRASDIPFVLPYDARIDAATRKQLLKNNPQGAFVYFNCGNTEREYMQLNNKVKGKFSLENKPYIRCALENPTATNLMAADQVAEKEGMGAGMTDCLIEAANKALVK